MSTEIATQLPKAPAEEPTEWGSLVRARRSPGVPLTLLTYVPEPDEVRDSRYSWYSDQDSWHVWSDLTDVEVLRVGVGEPTPEQVEADPAPVITDEVVRTACRAYHKSVMTPGTMPDAWMRAALEAGAL